MVALITDPSLEERLRAERQESGADRYDEVWDGVYLVSPLANNEHQELVNGLAFPLTAAIVSAGLGKVYPGVNVSDRETDWKRNYRCPDVVAFLNDTRAENRSTHWFGGPDFAVEVVSEGDRSREKLDFYARVGTRELLIVDHDPWVLELFRLEEAALKSVGKSTIANGTVLNSNVVPLTFQLAPGEERPRIEIAHTSSEDRWTV